MYYQSLKRVITVEAQKPDPSVPTKRHERSERYVTWAYETFGVIKFTCISASFFCMFMYRTDASPKKRPISLNASPPKIYHDTLFFFFHHSNSPSFKLSQIYQTFIYTLQYFLIPFFLIKLLIVTTFQVFEYSINARFLGFPLFCTVFFATFTAHELTRTSISLGTW